MKLVPDTEKIIFVAPREPLVLHGGKLLVIRAKRATVPCIEIATPKANNSSMNVCLIIMEWRFVPHVGWYRLRDAAAARIAVQACEA